MRWAVVGVAWLSSWAWAASAAGEAGGAPKRDEFALGLPRGVQLFDWKIDFSGEERLRAEHWSNADLNDRAKDTDGLFYLRSRLRMDAAFSETVRACIELADGREWLSSKKPRPQQNELDLHQAYLELHHLFDAPLMLRLGRQELDFGAKRLVSAPRWGNNIRSFDAARLSYSDDGVDIHGLLGSVVVPEEDHFDTNRHGEAIFGVYSTLKTFGAHKLDLYSLNLVSRNRQLQVPGEDGRLGNHERYTLGTRLFGEFTKRWTYDTEVACQFGHYAHDAVRAWAFHADTAYTLDLPWQPTIQPVLNIASGDKDPADGVRGTFDPLYTTTHNMYGGIADMVTWMNVKVVGLRLRAKPVPKLTVAAEAHRYWLMEDKDAWYTTGKGTRRRDTTGRSGDDIGTEIGCWARYSVNKRLEVEGGVARFFPGHMPEHTGHHSVVEFCYLQTTLKCW